MQIDLGGRTALVTGGNSGIGRAVSLALAGAGCDVATTYYSSSAGPLEEMRAMGRQAFQYQLDASDSAQVNSVVAAAAHDLGGHIDILVNNAGDMLGRIPLLEMTDEHWRRVLDVNLSSAFYCLRATAPYMDRGWGRIVMLSSLAGVTGGGTGAAAYAATKAALIALARGAAKELGPRGITVNSVAPGLILGTVFHDKVTPEAARQGSIARTPLRRAGTPEDVAGAVLYLVSDLAGFVTGDVIDITGGLWLT